MICQSGKSINQLNFMIQICTKILSCVSHVVLLKGRIESNRLEFRDVTLTPESSSKYDPNPQIEFQV